MKKPLIFHPFLFAFAPILFLYSYNIGQDSSLLGFSAILVGLTATIILILLCIIDHVLKYFHKSSLIVTLFVTMFYSYGPFCDINIVKDFLDKNFFLTIYGITIATHKIFLILWAIIFLVISYILIFNNRPLYSFNSLLNKIAIVLISISLVNIGMYAVTANAANLYQYDRNRLSHYSLDQNITTKYPDIYYIILDGYANNRTLKDIYNYDNSEFESSLRNAGFYIAEDSRSNYAFTDASISSSLNMEYINYLRYSNKNSKSMQPFYQKMRDNEVMKHLKLKGYKIILIGSGWPGTDFSPLADINLNGIKLGSPIQEDFLMVLLKMTILRPAVLYNNPYLFDNDRERILSSFSELAEVSKLGGPKFVFAHIVCPHPPFIFGKNGEYVSGSPGWGPKEPYLDQLIFVNKKIEVLIGELLSDQNKRPIIILQADHGPSSTFANWDSKNCSALNETMLMEKFFIFNAYYLPNIRNVPAYNSITPVNTFRLIFDSYLKDNYVLLDDVIYFSWYDNAYTFINVTESVNSKSLSI